MLWEPKGWESGLGSVSADGPHSMHAIHHPYLCYYYCQDFKILRLMHNQSREYTMTSLHRRLGAKKKKKERERQRKKKKVEKK